MQRSIIFNNEPKMLFFKYRVDESEVLKSFYYSEKDQGCIYINFGSFIELSNKDLRNVGKLCRTKETIIIDLRNNPGGYSEYYTKFIESLCKSKIEENILESKYVMSPSVKKSLDSVLFRNKGILRNMGYFLSGLRQRKVYKKNQYIVYKFVENKNTQERKLNKNIIFITNKQTASTAEYSILLTRYLNSGSTLVIGENTSGCISYGNNLIYQLPNSNISLNLPSFETIFNIDPVKECYGILPDYWCTSEDVDKTISYILNEV